MTTLRKTSSGNGHNYLKGHRFWKENQFWETEMYSQAAKEYYREWLQSLLKEEKRTYLMNKAA